MPGVLLLLAAAVRVLVALRTVMPARDAASYLWMAERIAAGDLEAAFATVFHPLYPLLVAGLLTLAPGLDGMAAGQIVACGAGTLAVLPLWALTKRAFGERAAAAAGLLYALAVWLVRHPAECLSEGLFFLLVVAAVERSTRERTRDYALAGVLAGLAYATRPEGAALALVGGAWLWTRGARRGALALGAGFLVAAAPWPLGWAVYGEGLTITPKLAFNWAVGVGGASSGIGHYLGHLVQVPGDLLEAIGYAAVPLAILALVKVRPRWRDPAGLLVALVALQIAVIPLLRSHFRFVSGYGVLLLPLAGLGWRELRPRWCALRPALRAALVLLAFAGDLVRLPVGQGQERVVERELGLWLRARLRPGEAVATEMPRVEYFAGVKPGPPRPIGRAEILAAAPGARFVAVVEPRTGVGAEDLVRLGLRPVDLPAELREAARARGIVAFERW